MSLIYDALRQQSGSVTTEPAATPRASWWQQQSAQRRGGLLLTAGALIAAPLAFLAAGQFGAPASSQPVTASTAGIVEAAPVADVVAPPVLQVQPVETTGVDTMAPIPVAAPLPVVAVTVPEPDPVTPSVAPEPASALAGLPVNPQAPLVSAETQPAPVQTAIPAPIPTVAQIQEEPQPIKIKVERRGEGSRTAASVQDDQSVQTAIAGIETAIADGDAVRTRQALADLEAMLPSSSLTLLRMQAWVAHREGDMEAAEQLYRRIAERVPDDENAGVNIALLSARRGDIDDARQRLTRLAGRHTRSALVARALSDIEAQAR